MRSIALVTDSSAAFPAETLATLLSEGGFAVADLPVSVDDQPVESLSSITVDEAIAMAHIQGQQVTTSGVAPGTFVDVYEDFAQQGYRGIVSMHLSSELSGTCDAARLAASMVDIPVAVVDSLNLAMGLGEPVARLHRLLTDESSLERATLLAEELCSSTELFFFVPTLDALKRGGRVSPALAMVGQMLQIRPVATVLDGKLSYLERPRTTAKAIERLIALTCDACGKRSGELPLDVSLKTSEARSLVRRSGKVVAIHYTGNLEQAKDLKFRLGGLAAEAKLSPLPPVLAAHAGLGALAVVVL